MFIPIIILLIALSGCTCGGYTAHYNVGKDVVKKKIVYCSSKDVSGLRVEHEGTIIELDKSDNEAGKVISEIVEKIPLF